MKSSLIDKDFIGIRCHGIPDGRGRFAGCLCCSTTADEDRDGNKLLQVRGEVKHLVIECSCMADVLVHGGSNVFILLVFGIED